MSALVFGVQARLQNGAHFDDFLRWQHAASTWADAHSCEPNVAIRRARVQAEKHPPSPLFFALFDDQIAHIPLLLESWRRAVETPYAIAALAQLWLAYEHVHQGAKPLPPIDALVERQVLVLVAAYPARTSNKELLDGAHNEVDSPNNRRETRATPSECSESSPIDRQRWIDFFQLPPRLQAERVLRKLRPSLHWELKCLEAVQQQHPRPLSEQELRALSDFESHGDPLRVETQHILRHFYRPERRASDLLNNAHPRTRAADFQPQCEALQPRSRSTHQRSNGPKA